MALGIRLKLLILAGLLAFQPVFAAKAEQRESAHVGNLVLSLMHQDGLCLLKNGDGTISLGIPAPCSFMARGSEAQAAVEKYGELSVVMVAGPPAHPADFDQIDYLKPEDACSHIGRAVFAENGRLRLGKILVSTLGFCPNIAPDEKYYYGLAHSGG